MEEKNLGLRLAAPMFSLVYDVGTNEKELQALDIALRIMVGIPNSNESIGEIRSSCNRGKFFEK